MGNIGIIINNNKMKYFRLRYENGDFEIVSGWTVLQVINKYDLATKEHINTTITELEGEQLAIAIDNNNKLI